MSLLVLASYLCSDFVKKIDTNEVERPKTVYIDIYPDQALTPFAVVMEDTDTEYAVDKDRGYNTLRGYPTFQFYWEKTDVAIYEHLLRRYVREFKEGKKVIFGEGSLTYSLDYLEITNARMYPEQIQDKPRYILETALKLQYETIKTD